MLTDEIQSWDERRDLIVPGDAQKTLAFAVEHWTHEAKRAMQQRGKFAVALSGGSTPKAIYEKLAQSKEIDWTNVWLFWSDERAVSTDHPESNYRMAMEAGLKNVPIPPDHIFRMVAETNIEKNVRDYEEKIQTHLDKHLFDLVMLGIGEDGHTASLFPNSPALVQGERLVTSAIFQGKKRMSLTFACINQSAHIAIYALGKKKAAIVEKALNAAISSPWPASRIGTEQHKALWILDTEAAYSIK